MGKNCYAQVFLEKCKIYFQRKKMGKFIMIDESDKLDDSDEESDAE